MPLARVTSRSPAIGYVDEDPNVSHRFAIVAFALLAAAAIGALFLQPPRSGDAPQPSAGSEAVETQDGLPPSRE